MQNGFVGPIDFRFFLMSLGGLFFRRSVSTMWFISWKSSDYFGCPTVRPFVWPESSLSSGRNHGRILVLIWANISLGPDFKVLL